MSDRRPSVFVGSSTEGLPIAEAIQLNLDYACETIIWSQGVFGLSGGTLETLISELPQFDFAALVLTPDDLIYSRDVQQVSPRDNVLLELGLCIGALGRERTFIVYDRAADLKLPTDLAGVTPATYQHHESGTLQSSVGAASTFIKRAIEKHGLRVKEKPTSEPITATSMASKQITTDEVDATAISEKPEKIIECKLYYDDDVAPEAIAIKRLLEKKSLVVEMDVMNSEKGAGDAKILYYKNSADLELGLELVDVLKESGIEVLKKAPWENASGDFILWLV